MRSPLDWMRLQVETLFRLDSDGHLVALNQPKYAAAPLVFLGRTTAGNVWHTGVGLPPALARDAEALVRAEPVASDFSAEPVCAGALHARLRAFRELGANYRGPAFHFPHAASAPTASTAPVGPAAGAAVRVGASELARFFPGLAGDLEAAEPCFGILEDGVAVSVCHSARSSHAAAEAGVETAEPYRGRAFAPRVVAAWAAEVLRSGREPLYSTWWANEASRRVAARLGLVCYGEDFHLT